MSAKTRNRLALATGLLGATAAAVLLWILLPDPNNHVSSVPLRRLPRSRVERVARRVEAIRGLRFKTLPRVTIVSRAQMAQLPDDYTAAEQRENRMEDGEYQVLTLLGMIPADFDVSALRRESIGSAAGAYNTASGAIALPDDVADPDPHSGEQVLAHELDHALEQQNAPRPGYLDTDASHAYTDLSEGVATYVEYEYGRRYLGQNGSLHRWVTRRALTSDDLRSVFARHAGARPYTRGALFVDALRRAGSLSAVDAAEHRPPVSTAQTDHPELWRRNVRPARVRVRGARGWRTIARSTFGEFETSELLHATGYRARARELDDDWAGGTFELLAGRGQKAGVVAWEWRRPADLRGQKAMFRSYAKVWLGDTGRHAAFADGGRRSVLAVAPTAAQARALARASL
jgi:hypothetical protein